MAGRLRMCIFLNQKMAQAWKDEEKLKLIELWGESNIQEELEGCRRYNHIFYKLSSEMGSAGFQKSCTHCRENIKKYKKIKDCNKPTGTDRMSRKFYDKLNKILSQPQNLML